MNKQDHDDGAIITALTFFFLLGLWLGFSMGTGSQGVRATLPMMGEQLWYTLMGNAR